MGQGRHQLFAAGARELHRLIRRGRVVYHAPDAPAISAFVQAVLLLQVARDGRVVFDDLAVHVDHVQRSVGPGAEVHRTKPTFAAGEELALLESGRPPQEDLGTLAVGQRAADQILLRFAGEHVAVVLGWKRVAAIERRGAGGGEAAVGCRFSLAVEFSPGLLATPFAPPGMRLADRVHVVKRGRRMIGRRRCNVSVARLIAIGNRHHLEAAGAVADQEPVVEIREAHSEPARHARRWLERRPVGTKTKRVCSHPHRFGELRARDGYLVATTATGIDPVVESPAEVVRTAPEFARV